MPSVPHVCFYGDDFTGAVANLAGFNHAGLFTFLFLKTPSEERARKYADGLDALGVAGASRSLPPGAMRAAIEPAFRLFRAIGSPIVQYKICTTFDSSPDTGSFGEVLALGSEVFGDAAVPVLTACPSFGRFTVFGNHFANFRGEVFRLDRHPVMARHPSTPMDEADLRMHLQRQTRRRVGLVDILTVKAGARTMAEAFARDEAPAIILDALDEADIDAIASFYWILATDRTVFTLAGQGLAIGLGRHIARIDDGPRKTEATPVQPVERLLVLSGSASAQTEVQIRRALDRGWAGLALDAEKLLGGPGEQENLRASLIDKLSLILSSGRSAIVYSALGPDDPAIDRCRALLAECGMTNDQLVMRMGQLYGRVAADAVERLGLRRIVFAGGDTSSIATQEIDAFGLRICGTSRTGGSISRLYSDNRRIDGLEVLLKAGQSGSDDVLLHACSGQGWS